RKQRLARVEAMRWQRQRLRSVHGKTLGIVLAVEAREESGGDDSEVVALRNRHQMLPSDGLAARFDAALVVAGAWSAEARLEEVVRRERFEARRQLALGADQMLRYCRLEIVVRDALRNAGKMLEGAHVAVEKAHL